VKSQGEDGSRLGQGLVHIGDLTKHLPGKNISVALESDLPEEQYDCPICRDARFVHPRGEDDKIDYSQVVPCECVKEELAREKVQAMLRMCELPPKTVHMTFDNFKMGPGLEEVYEATLALAEERSDSDWLALISDSNRGKTHLLVAACRHWLTRGKPARYAYVPLLMEELRRGYREEGDRSYDSRFDFFLNVPMLALDDLGVENRTPWVQEKLDTIVDYRLMNGLALVVTTNLTMDGLNFRVASRLRRNGKVIYIDAPEYET